MGKFADPDVSDEVVTSVSEQLSEIEPAYPWDLLDAVYVDTEQARLALRKLRMANEIVPAEPFKGKVRTAGDNDD